ncbi:MAG: hypothetical protein R3F56_13395 [Planctomycetota bacterium]
MRDPHAAARGSGYWTDSFALAGAMFALAVALRQRAFHGLDAQYFLAQLRDHGDANYSHPLFLPLMHGWHGLWSKLGWSPFQSMRLASAVGASIGALAVHRAGRVLGLARSSALLAAALACATPAVVFFATVVEIHGPFFAFAGLAFWAWAHAHATAASTAAASIPFAFLGATTALAAGVHTSGHALLWLLPALSLGLAPPRRPRPCWRHWLVTAAVHAAVTLAVVGTLGSSGGGPWRERLEQALAYWGPRVPLAPLEILALLQREWLLPFLPLSAATLLALAWRNQRRLALAVLAGIAPLLGLVWLLLHRELYERGAYLLPFAWPAAVLLVGWWPRALQSAALVAALALAIASVVRHDHVGDDAALQHALLPATEGGPALVICIDMAEVEQVLRTLPAATPRPLEGLTPAVAAGYEATCSEFDAWVQPFLDAGTSVWLTPRARAYLDVVPLPSVRRFVAEHLDGRYVLVPLDDPDFPALRLRRH